MAASASSTMSRTGRGWSGMVGHLLTGGAGRVFDRLDEKPDPAAELRRDALERRKDVLVAPGLARRVGDAPVDQGRVGGELGAHLAHAIAQADHVVEALVGELAR